MWHHRVVICIYSMETSTTSCTPPLIERERSHNFPLEYVHSTCRICRTLPRFVIQPHENGTSGIKNPYRARRPLKSRMVASGDGVTVIVRKDSNFSRNVVVLEFIAPEYSYHKEQRLCTATLFVSLLFQRKKNRVKKRQWWKGYSVVGEEREVG